MAKFEAQDWSIDNVEAVLFDKDGTIIDLHYFWGKITEMRAKSTIARFNLPKSSFNKLCSFLGYDVCLRKMLPDGITALYSRPKIIKLYTEELLKLGAKTEDTDIEKLFDDVSREFYKDIDSYTKPIDDAIDFIKVLYYKNIKMGIVTSDSLEATLLTLKKNEWEKYFSVVIGRESSAESKESGVPTLMALENLGVSPNKVLMIGDAPMDYISAKNAGIKNTILVATGQVDANNLKKTTPYVLESLKGLRCI